MQKKLFLIMLCTTIFNSFGMIKKEYQTLHDAIEADDASEAISFIRAGADVNGFNEKGKLPLYYANTNEMRELLEDSGANFLLPDRSGKVYIRLLDQIFEIDVNNQPECIPLEEAEELKAVPQLRPASYRRQSSRPRKFTQRYSAYLAAKKKK